MYLFKAMAPRIWNVKLRRQLPKYIYIITWNDLPRIGLVTSNIKKFYEVCCVFITQAD